MLPRFTLNSESTNLIKGLIQQFKNLDYNTELGCNPNGSIYFTVVKFDGTSNRFDFYGNPNGDIDSIAIYGSNLQKHLNNILDKRTIFGLPIEDAEIDRGGMENYVDIQIKSDYILSHRIVLIKINYGSRPSEHDLCERIAQYDNAECSISEEYLKLSLENNIFETILTAFEDDTLTRTWLGKYENGTAFRVVRPSNLYREHNLGDEYITIASTYHDGYAVHFLLQ